jgi:AraC-like DNA-binding protein
MMWDLVGGFLDSMTVFPVAIIVMLTMLQDRKRPLWPVAVMMSPIVAVGALSVANRSYAFLPVVSVYFLLMCIGLVSYMIRASRQYGRWLRDNYADLEHKEVWQSFAILAIMLLVFAAYAFVSEGPAYQYAMQIIIVVLICYLLWRVETLSDLSISESTTKNVEDNAMSLSIRKNIGSLLKLHCEKSQLYLQYDLTLSQLSQIIGTNRLYLSQHFSSQGMTYNEYINGLRIQHFVNLYHDAVATHQPITAQQLANQSGFRSYNTFSIAFKKIKGMTATEWMRNIEEKG